MNKNLVGRLRQQGLWLAAGIVLFGTGRLSAGSAAGRPESAIVQLPIPVYGDSTRWGRYFRQLQDTVATRWYEEITYYSERFAYSRGTVTARFVVTPDGTFHDPQIVSNTANSLMADAVIRSILKTWIGRFPAEVRAMAPSGIVLEQTFRYWDYDPTNYGWASSYPQMLTRRSPEIGGAYNLDIRKFFDLSRFHFQSRILQATPADSRLESWCAENSDDSGSYRLARRKTESSSVRVLE
jgi:hypothetical protein